MSKGDEEWENLIRMLTIVGIKEYSSESKYIFFLKDGCI